MAKRKAPANDHGEHASEVLSQLYTIRSMVMVDMFRAGVSTADFDASHSLAVLDRKISQTRLDMDISLFDRFVKRARTDPGWV